jgi:hypothetical protein
MTPEPDYYEILQVSPQAEPDVIQAAYRRLARKHHPDVNPSLDSADRMSELNRALEVLTDPRKRAEYDGRRLRALAIMSPEDAAPQPYTPYYKPEPVPWPARLAMLPVSWLLIGSGATVIVMALGLIIFQASDDSGGDRTAAGTVAPAPSSSSGVAVAGESSAPTGPPVVSPAPGSSTFTNGTWLVGEEIAPGIWRALRSRNCSWKRLSSIEGSTDVVAATGSFLTVEVAPNDAAFWSEGCGWWTQILSPPSSSTSGPFGPGTWLVNEEIAPGLWQNSDASEGCSWWRLSNLSDGEGAVLDNGFGYSNLTVEISATDRAFDSKGCGTWTRVEG